MIVTFKLLKNSDSLNEAWLRDAAYLRPIEMEPNTLFSSSSEQLLDYVRSLARQWQLRFVCAHLITNAQELAAEFKRCGFSRDPAGDRFRDEKLLEGYRLDLGA